MKIKYIIPAIVAAAMAFTGCSDEKDTYLDEIKVSQSYVSLPIKGGSTTFTVTATDSWTLEEYIAVKTGEKDEAGKDIVKYVSHPDWLNVSATSGAAGENVITLSADETLDGRTTALHIQSSGKTQIVEIIQGISEAAEVKCEDIIAGPDSKTYKVTGVVSSIVNTTYGNWYLKDDTGEVYIYGTLDANGAEKNFLSLGIEAGDVVTVTGPKTTYGSTVELVNVTVNKIVKSLVKVEPSKVNLEKEASDFTVDVIYSGDNYEFTNEADWLSITGTTIVKDTLRVSLHAAENTAASNRTGVINFTSSRGKSTSTVALTVSQKGAVIEAAVKDLLAADDNNNVIYRTTGYISAITDLAKGRFDITDYSGKIYCYNTNVAEGNTSTNVSSKVALGDVVTIVGYKTSYNGTKEFCGYIESFQKVTEITVADFLTKADDKNVLYRLTGVITDGADEAAGKKFDIAKYGNFDLVDETGTLYVYGVSTGLNGETGKFNTIGAVKGDEITLVGYKTTYAAKNLVQLGGAWLVSFESADVPDPVISSDPYESSLNADHIISGDNNAATDNIVKIGSKDYFALKLGSSSAPSSAEIFVPKGSTALTFYAYGWKGKASKFKASMGDTVLVEEQSVVSNDGIANSSPFTVSAPNASDKYTVSFPAPLAKRTKIKIETLSGATRAVFFGINYVKPE